MTDVRCRRAQCFTTGTDAPFLCVCVKLMAGHDCSCYTSESCSTTQGSEEGGFRGHKLRLIDAGATWL